MSDLLADLALIGSSHAVLHRLREAESRRRAVLRAVRDPAGDPGRRRLRCAEPVRGGDGDDHLRRPGEGRDLRPQAQPGRRGRGRRPPERARPAGRAARARAPAAGSCSTSTSSRPAGTPTARSSSTTSPSRAGTRSSTGPARLLGAGRRAASTAPTSTVTASTTSTCATVTRSRSASTASSSSPAPGSRADGATPLRLVAPSPVRPPALQHRAGARPAASGLPRRHDPQDPLPRGQGPDQARAHARGLPQVLRRRRRPAPLRPADAARPLPAAQGHRRAPRRDRPWPRAAADRVGGADRAQGGPGRRRAAQRRVVRRPQRHAAVAARAGQDRRDLHRPARPARAVRPDHRRARAPATTTPTRW